MLAASLHRSTPMTRPADSAPSSPWTLETLRWEELPAISDPLGRRVAALAATRERGSAPPAWEVTGVDSDPFRQPLDGLAVREIDEPELFRRFFGRSAG